MLKRPSVLALLILAACVPRILAAATPVPAAPAVNAEAYMLLDFMSGAVLAEKDADRRVEPASITKVMTTYVIFKELEAGNLGLDDMVTVSDNAWRKSMRTSRMFLEPRTSVSIRELLMGVIIQSGNDASIALAEHVAGSETTFAAMMNAYAAQLGMSGTHFTNSTGLPGADHYTTARDLVTLAAATIREFPQFYEWYSLPEYTYNGISQPNRNKLLRQEEGADGIKTGWTESAGYCLLASAVRDDRRLISVVLDSPKESARTTASKALLNYGFRFFETHRLYGAGETITSTRVWMGSTDTVGLGIKDDLFITVPRGRYEDLVAVMDLQEQLAAPLDTSAAVGSLSISLDDELIVRQEMYPVEPVPEGSLWQRLSDQVMLWFE